MIQIGYIVHKNLKYGYGDKITTRNKDHTFEVLDIYPDEKETKKDIMLCKDVDYGYKECFFRMDLTEVIESCQ